MFPLVVPRSAVRMVGSLCDGPASHCYQDANQLTGGILVNGCTSAHELVTLVVSLVSLSSILANQRVADASLHKSADVLCATEVD
jgi:hypothetical protein